MPRQTLKRLSSLRYYLIGVEVSKCLDKRMETVDVMQILGGFETEEACNKFALRTLGKVVYRMRLELIKEIV